MADISSLTDNLNVKNSNFICGVVEGFYGRPWTTEQRKDLFQKMKKWGMDSYLYAPKDDYKHRVYWRELYTVEEAEHLTGLITAAQECGINFYYALSPGLDITYSSTKEVSTLKRKLEQVYQFGCTAFALLFDDIESEMSEADKEVFQSFAHAQVSITNEVYQHLSQPKFLLCPTQYCAARAVPNVSNSEYLNTLGSKLAPDIDIMWTGPKVISRLLTVESIEEITEVLRRPPVIWDNIHANDYDQKRVFLGPYQGRSPDLIPKLRGVLTNPNCEYGCNFVAIHTLAQWSRCSIDGLRDLSLNDSVSADIKLEIESEDGGLSEDVPSSLPTNIYHPRRALRNAINEWLLEFQRHKQVYGPIQKPQPQVAVAIPVPVILPSINTCMSLTPTTTSVTDSQPNNTNQLQALAEVCSAVNGADSLMQPTPAVTLTGPAVVMNSLASENKVISEPMDCKTTPTSECLSSDTSVSCSSFPGDANSKMQMESPSPSSQTMIVDPPTNTPETNGTEAKKSPEEELRYEDLALLCDLFYLPFEHGVQGVQLLQEFNWLKSNAHHVSSTSHCRKNAEKTPEAQEWFERAKKLNDCAEALNQLMDRLTTCNNRELLYDLYPYVWDMRGVVSLLNSYVKWLAIGHFPQMITSFTLGNYTWFSKGWKESFMSGEQEPWVFRGGLTADLQRLVPVDAGSDLFIYKAPDVPVNKTYTIRPYLFEDEQGVYGVCRRTCLDGNDGSEIFAQNCDLPGDRLVAGFLILSPELCFVVEDETGIVGYACAALNAKQFYTQLESSWLPVMCTKYPLNDASSPPPNKHVEEMIKWFHSFKGESLPSASHANHPSVMCCNLLSTVSDQSVAKRLVICLLAALRANGSFGVCVSLDAKDRNLVDFYTKLGFLELCQGFSTETSYLGRSF